MDARGDEPVGPWTLREGVRLALSILAPRALLAAIAWAVPLLSFRAAIAALDVPRDPVDALLRASTRAEDLVRHARYASHVESTALLFGFAIGWFVNRRLVRLVNFTGWIPPALSVAAATVAIVVPTLVLLPGFPPEATATVWATAAIGAISAVLAIGAQTLNE